MTRCSADGFSKRSKAGKAHPELEGEYRHRSIFETFRADWRWIFVVYIKEAHPVDGWASAKNERQGILIKDPKTYEERVKVAAETCSKLETNIPCLVDGINDEVNAAYAAWPDRLYVVDKDGTIAIAGGQGPRGCLPAVDQATTWLAENTK